MRVKFYCHPYSTGWNLSFLLCRIEVKSPSVSEPARRLCGKEYITVPSCAGLCRAALNSSLRKEFTGRPFWRVGMGLLWGLFGFVRRGSDDAPVPLVHGFRAVFSNGVALSESYRM